VFWIDIALTGYGDKQQVFWEGRRFSTKEKKTLVGWLANRSACYPHMAAGPTKAILVCALARDTTGKMKREERNRSDMQMEQLTEEDDDIREFIRQAFNLWVPFLILSFFLLSSLSNTHSHILVDLSSKKHGHDFT